ncbi:hypothetical protein AK812_SmicGene16287 [Symbiodinium microadriaticum]|uniref:Uncharacterized protein n=1 Tax=Symbiodinium microadriaticum TaxID=2951 RepID=A0A1Q9E0R8_SYMMI|nr:hypothetical protein AK812_SmicGene16287 [Symbiodinium microadriaticum]
MFRACAVVLVCRIRLCKGVERTQGAERPYLIDSLEPGKHDFQKLKRELVTAITKVPDILIHFAWVHIDFFVDNP